MTLTPLTSSDSSPERLTPPLSPTLAAVLSSDSSPEIPVDESLFVSPLSLDDSPETPEPALDDSPEMLAITPELVLDDSPEMLTITPEPALAAALSLGASPMPLASTPQPDLAAALSLDGSPDTLIDTPFLLPLDTRYPDVVINNQVHLLSQIIACCLMSKRPDRTMQATLERIEGELSGPEEHQALNQKLFSAIKKRALQNPSMAHKDHLPFFCKTLLQLIERRWHQVHHPVAALDALAGLTQVPALIGVDEEGVLALAQLFQRCLDLYINEFTDMDPENRILLQLNQIDNWTAAALALAKGRTSASPLYTEICFATACVIEGLKALPARTFSISDDILPAIGRPNTRFDLIKRALLKKSHGWYADAWQIRMEEINYLHRKHKDEEKDILESTLDIIGKYSGKKLSKASPESWPVLYAAVNSLSTLFAHSKSKEIQMGVLVGRETTPGLVALITQEIDYPDKHNCVCKHAVQQFKTLCHATNFDVTKAVSRGSRLLIDSIMLWKESRLLSRLPSHIVSGTLQATEQKEWVLELPPSLSDLQISNLLHLLSGLLTDCLRGDDGKNSTMKKMLEETMNVPGISGEEKAVLQAIKGQMSSSMNPTDHLSLICESLTQIIERKWYQVKNPSTVLTALFSLCEAGVLTKINSDKTILQLARLFHRLMDLHTFVITKALEEDFDKLTGKWDLENIKNMMTPHNQQLLSRNTIDSWTNAAQLLLRSRQSSSPLYPELLFTVNAVIEGVKLLPSQEDSWITRATALCSLGSAVKLGIKLVKQLSDGWYPTAWEMRMQALDYRHPEKTQDEATVLQTLENVFQEHTGNISDRLNLPSVNWHILFAALDTIGLLIEKSPSEDTQRQLFLGTCGLVAIIEQKVAYPDHSRYVYEQALRTLDALCKKADSRLHHLISSLFTAQESSVDLPPSKGLLIPSPLIAERIEAVFGAGHVETRFNAWHEVGQINRQTKGRVNLATVARTHFNTCHTLIEEAKKEQNWDQAVLLIEGMATIAHLSRFPADKGNLNDLFRDVYQAAALEDSKLDKNFFIAAVLNISPVATPRELKAILEKPETIYFSSLKTPEEFKKSLELLCPIALQEPNLESFYRKLPVHSQELFLTTMEAHHATNLQPLYLIPNPNGSRPIISRKQTEWKAKLAMLFDDKATTQPQFRLRTPQKVVKSFLKPEVTQQLFDAEGNWLTKTNPKGNHTVYPVTSGGEKFWFKIYPEQAGMEQAISFLSSLLYGDGTPHYAVASLQGCAVLISSHVEGICFDEATDQQFKQIDPVSFAWTFLRTLLINPEDDKGDGYFLVPSGNAFQIVRIDNERVFFSPTAKNRLGLSEALQVKTVIYCMDQMKQPLNTEVLREFLALDPLKFLHNWLGMLNQEQQGYLYLFTKEQVRDHFKRKPSSIIPVMLSTTLISELLKRFELMQGTIKNKLDTNTVLTASGLLETVEPTLVPYYELPFQQPLAGPKERFAFLDNEFKLYNHRKGEYTSKVPSTAVTGTLKLQTNLDLGDVLLSFLGEKYAPKQSADYLKELSHVQLDEFLNNLINGKRQNWSFAQLSRKQQALVMTSFEKRSNKTDAERRKLLEAIATVIFSTLDLSPHAHMLTNDLAKPILKQSGAHLSVVDFHGCKLLDDSIIEYLSSSCPNLTQLNIDDTTITALSSSILRKPLQFDNLEFLSGRNCFLLTTASLLTPRLKTLILPWAVQLTSLKVKGALKFLDCSYCRTLSSLEVEHGGLDELVLTECRKISHWQFRQNYPWLAPLPWDSYSDSTMALLNSTLARAAANDQITFKQIPQATKQIWSQNLKTSMTALENIIDSFLGFLKNKSSHIREITIKTLGKIGAANPSVVIPALLNASKDSVLEKEIKEIYEALGEVGKESPEALTHILNALAAAIKNKNWDLAQTLQEVLSKMGRQSPEAITSALSTAIKNKNWDLAEALLLVLWEVGQVKPQAVIAGFSIAINEGATSNIPRVALSLLTRLRDLDPQIVLNILLNALKNIDSEIEQAVRDIPRKEGAAISQAVISGVSTLYSSTRMTIVEALETFGKVDPLATIPALLTLFEHSDMELKIAIVKALGMLGSANAYAVVPPLLTALQSSHLGLKKAALEAFSNLEGVDLEVTIPFLKIALTDDDPEVRGNAIVLLGQIGESNSESFTPIFLAALGDSHPYVKTKAMYALQTVFKADVKAFLSILVPTLNDEQPHVRITAMMMLKGLLKANLQTDTLKVIIPILVTSLEDSNADVQKLAVDALSIVGEIDPQATMPFLLATLKSDNLSTVKAILRVFEKIGRYHPRIAISGLLAAYTNKDPSVRRKVIWILGELRENDLEIILPTLLTALEDEDPGVNSAAVTVLGKVGKAHPQTIIPVLLATLKNSKLGIVRAKAATALAELGKELCEPEKADLKTVIPALLTALEDSSSDVRNAAAEGLLRLGTTYPHLTIPYLLTAINSGNLFIVKTAIIILDKVEMAAPKVVAPALLNIIRNPNGEDVKELAIEAIKTIGMSAEEADQKAIVDVLLSLNNNPVLRKWIIRALGVMVEVNPQVIIPVLFHAIKDPGLEVSAAAIAAVIKAGTIDPLTVLPALSQMLQNDSKGLECYEMIAAAGHFDIISTVLATYNAALRPFLTILPWEQKGSLPTSSSIENLVLASAEIKLPQTPVSTISTSSSKISKQTAVLQKHPASKTIRSIISSLEKLEQDEGKGSQRSKHMTPVLSLCTALEEMSSNPNITIKEVKEAINKAILSIKEEKSSTPYFSRRKLYIAVLESALQDIEQGRI